MRIEWKEESALVILRKLKSIQQTLEAGEQKSSLVRNALAEADPDGSNKRIKAIGEAFEATVVKLKRVIENVDEMTKATNRMINLFEDSERDAIRLLRSLEEGFRAGKMEPRHTGLGTAYAIVDTVAQLPIELPEPVVMPAARVSAFGEAPDWLEALMNEYYRL